MKKKFIFITGGVVSSIGKGVITASIGKILISSGYKTALLKIDPYLNVDPGTMSPYQHGEVFVTYDGAETDLDLGHYERFTGQKMKKENNTTSGQIYYRVLENERTGKYLGQTVQVIPHLIDEIKKKIYSMDADTVVVEVGGTVGDIEGLPFLEAIRQIKLEFPHTLTIHITYVPLLESVGELKTKPTQHSVNKLREIGVNPDCIVARSRLPISKELKNKIALFSNLPVENILNIEDVETIYEVPQRLINEGIARTLKKLNIKIDKESTSDLNKFVAKYRNIKNKPGIKIAVAGKYVELIDSYKSLNEALMHAYVNTGINVSLDYINTEKMERDLNQYAGFIIPGGFGVRGVEGKLKTIEFARNAKKPILGLCFGMQLMAIEVLRNKLNFRADSRELNPKTKNPVVEIIPSAKEKIGGTMKLGEHRCNIETSTLAYKIYKSKTIYERHRHRYEINKKYAGLLEKSGLKISGRGADGSIEIIELKSHPFFIGTQFHPEFTSTPLKPNPVFVEFIKACNDSKD